MPYASAAERIIRQMTPLVSVAGAKPLQELVGEQSEYSRIRRTLLAIYAAIALLLAALGLYGLMAYLVNRRRREIGVRVALGASPGRVLGLVLAGGMRLAALGLVIGIAGGWFAAQFLRSELYATGLADPKSYVTSALLLLSIAAAGCLVPAARAALIDPAQCLRSE